MWKIKERETEARGRGVRASRWPLLKEVLDFLGPTRFYRFNVENIRRPACLGALRVSGRLDDGFLPRPRGQRPREVTHPARLRFSLAAVRRRWFHVWFYTLAVSGSAESPGLGALVLSCRPSQHPAHPIHCAPPPPPPPTALPLFHSLSISSYFFSRVTDNLHERLVCTTSS